MSRKRRGGNEIIGVELLFALICFVFLHLNIGTGESETQKAMTKTIVSLWLAVVLMIVAVVFLTFSVLSGIAASAKVSSDDIHLNVRILGSAGVIANTSDLVAVHYPAQYQVDYTVPSGADCISNFTRGPVYDSGSVKSTVNGSVTETYSISCQPLIGHGGVVSKSVTVSALPYTEIRALASRSAF